MKIKVGTKLLLSYLSILVIVFITTVYGFNRIITETMRNEAYEQLKEQSELLIKFLYEEYPLNEGVIHPLSRELFTQIKFSVAGYLINTDFVLLDESYNIIYQSFNQLTQEEIKLLLSNQERYYQNYMKLTTVVENDLSQPVGYLILFTRINEIDQLRVGFISILQLSFVIGGVVAFVVGFFMTRTLIRPLKILEREMIHVSKNSKEPLQPIETGDEFEELYKVFKRMVTQLNLNEDLRRNFFQNASHELKTPLMSIQGYAEAIKDGVLEEEEQEDGLEIIISQSQKLKKIVDEMIYLTNLESESMPYEFRVQPIGYPIEEAIRAIKHMAEEHHITIQLVEANLAEYVKQDGEKLMQVFTNLLSNALRYAKNTIKVNILKINKTLKIYIEDDGDGLAMGEDKKVFERFYKGNKGGTGLGLAISKSIIDAHAGMIKAYNNAQGGATFEVTLSLADKKEKKNAQ